MFFSEFEEFNYTLATRAWTVNLEYGNWEDGSVGDGSRNEDINVAVPKVIMIIIK